MPAGAANAAAEAFDSAGNSVQQGAQEQSEAAYYAIQNPQFRGGKAFNDVRRANDAEVTRQVQELNTLNITNSIQLGLKDFMCVSSNGEQFNLNFRNSFGDSLNVADIEAFAANLAKSGAILVSQQGPQETGYWNPMVVTDEKGEAKLTITMPEQSTAWKVNAKGITADTLAGEAELEIVAKKELFGELKLPLAFTDGDDAEILVGVHFDLPKDKARERPRDVEDDHRRAND